MADKNTSTKKNSRESKITVKKQDEGNTPKRQSALGFDQQKLTFEQIKEILERNVKKTVSKSYTQYTKESVRTYLKNPNSNLNNIIQVSRFLERNSTLYKKMLTYYASAPLFYYNLTQDNDLSKNLNANKLMKDFYNVAKQINGINLPKEFFNAIYCTVRDGMYVGYTYQTDETSFFLPLDISYCRIYGKNEAGEWIVYFDASFFSGNNSIYVEGVDGDGVGVWDDVFVQGYRAYQEDSANSRWFMLPTEKTFCLIAGSDDQFDTPLPLFSGLFTLLMDIADLGDVLAEKTALENYKLLVSKIPLLKDNDVDDFAISLELAQEFDALFDNVLPDLVGHVTTPMDLDTVSFEKSNTTQDTDALAQSTQNLFNNAGMSQLVVAGGNSTNSVGLKFSIMNDMSNIWIYVNRIESWLNYYIKMNISDGYKLQIHKISWYNRDEYITEKKDIATLGGSAMDYLTSSGDSPYIAYQKLNFENMSDIKSLMIPLQTSFTQSTSDNTGGAPTKDDTELSPEGEATRDDSKNEKTKANK